jgi:hypothetical protein
VIHHVKVIGSVTVKHKTFTYTLERVREGVVHFVAKDANINQEFLSEDVSELILDLPSLIIAEQSYRQKQSDVVRFRISGRDKARIEKKALEKDYASISSYLRDLALQ